VIIRRLEVKNFRSLKGIGEKYYQEARALIADDLVYSETSKALKNPEAAAQLIHSIYEAGKKLPVLEEIVEAVSAMI
jgi:hypothetical protein